MKFLIIKTSSLGDIIHALEAVIQLKKSFPDSRIDWVVESDFAEIVQRFSLINKTLKINTRHWRKKLFDITTWKELKFFRKALRQETYDAVFDLQGNMKSAWVLAQARSECKIGFGLKTIHEWPNIFFTHYRFNPALESNVREENKYLIEAYLKKFYPTVLLDLPMKGQEVAFEITEDEKNNIADILKNPSLENSFKILVCPGSNWMNKQLPCETISELLVRIHQFKKKSFFLFAWGNDKEKFIAERLQAQFPLNGAVIPRLALPQLQNLMKKMQLVIAMDSLPLHLCGTTSTPSFGIFGPSLASKFQPVGSNHLSHQGNCPYGRVFTRRCPILRTCPTGKCMLDIEAETLFNHLSNLLGN